ncbi:MAG: 1-acyl-sn-glycerol-3-phosphate acyltransferase [Deltaproteobacteria bacterium]|nr:1-acyl-sn-glycerol-3-phosphate acyltransferase [Deltaproteobacteria bacterium]
MEKLKLYFFRISQVIGWPILTLLYLAYAILFSLITWHPYTVIDRGARIWSKLMLALAGMKLRIHGKENIDPNLQYLFLSNHQSLLDIFIILLATPPRTVFVGKQSFLAIPVVGWLFGLSGQIAIDRSHHEKAIEGLKRAEQKIAQGHHLYMAPEGTRSKDGTLGPLKRGAFHIALHTRLPIIPITIVEAYRRLPKYRILVNPGEIAVQIDKAIETQAWKEETLETHMDEIRRAFLHHLAA